MNSRFTALHDYLSTSTSDKKAVDVTLTAIEPLIKNADAGQYKLQPKVNVQLVIDAVDALELGTPSIRQVVSVSVSQLIPQPDWMNETIYRRILQGEQWFSGFWPPLISALDRSVEPKLPDLLRARANRPWGKDLVDRYERCLGKDLQASLKGRMADILNGGRLSGLLIAAFEAVRHGETCSERFTPLLSLLPDTIPLGWLNDTRSTFIVLVG